MRLLDKHAPRRQVLGIPNQARRRKTGRLEALAYYREEYTGNRVMKFAEAPAPTLDADADESDAGASGSGYLGWESNTD
ncbi:hypothetical protein B0H10DRAFT_2247390 [Mycena sp. CBHHK59/15]|nr:hypothetical protein B0H10DRAFT_2247390 [Mycena sp. CBHHK59/15]